MKKHLALVTFASLLAAIACNKHDRVSAAGPATPPAAPSTTSVVPASTLGVPASLAKLTPNERKAIAGIGAFGFVTGPFVGYNTSVGVNKGSSMTIAMLPSCRSADYDNSLKYGVGYQMPNLVVNAINIFLHVLNIKPIEGEGGVTFEKQLARTHEFYPANCDATAAT